MVDSTDLPGSLTGGGNDTLQGGSARDSLNGGVGADLLSGMDGNDLFKADDGSLRSGHRCGGGSDKADLDLLPQDPNVQRCENKTRH